MLQWRNRYQQRTSTRGRACDHGGVWAPPPAWAVLPCPLSRNFRNVNSTFTACLRDPGGTSSYIWIFLILPQGAAGSSESSQTPNDGNSQNDTGLSSLHPRMSNMESEQLDSSIWPYPSSPKSRWIQQHDREEPPNKMGRCVAFLEVTARTRWSQGRGLLEPFLRERTSIFTHLLIFEGNKSLSSWDRHDRS